VEASNGANSIFIRANTGGDVSHALLYAGQNIIVEAVEEGVREVGITEALGEATLAIALRYPRLSKEQRQQIIDNARSFLHRKYDYVGAGGTLHGRRGTLIYIGACSIVGILPCMGGRKAIKNNAKPEHADDKFFCSELVTRAYEMAGVKIVDGEPSYTNPRMIHYSKKLQYLGHLVGG
jgi:uncharacterized protein YycO